MKCIVGMGNPGKPYEKTRHNVGFRVIDGLLQKHGVKPSNKFKSEIAQIKINGTNVLCVKPLTFMNLSGEAIRLVMDFYKLAPEDFLIIYDDLDLPVGKLRLREKGSAGGHNGMKSTIQHLGTQQFPRLRIGIDKSPIIPTVDYVLGKFTKEEEERLESVIKRSVQCAEDFASIKFVDLMTKYNTIE